MAPPSIIITEAPTKTSSLIPPSFIYHPQTISKSCQLYFSSIFQTHSVLSNPILPLWSKPSSLTQSPQWPINRLPYCQSFPHCATISSPTKQPGVIYKHQGQGYLLHLPRTQNTERGLPHSSTQCAERKNEQSSPLPTHSCLPLTQKRTPNSY